jgi:hypothetical protein
MGKFMDAVHGDAVSQGTPTVSPRIYGQDLMK